MKKLLRGGFVVTPRGSRRADVLLDGEKITRHGVSPFVNFGLRCCPDLKAF